jgi:hypothetical protein
VSGGISLRGVRDWCLRNAIRVWPTIAAAASILYIGLIVKPFSKTAIETKAIDVAKAWNNAVSQLGISPLYPPQEDFFVGDLWAIVVKAPDQSLVGRGVRVGHVDLSDAIKSEYNDRVTIAKLSGAQSKESGDRDPVDTHIHLFALAFPGISVSHSSIDSGGSTLPFLSFVSSKGRQESDEVRIPQAETYGANVPEAMISFYAYCKQPETAIRCTKRFAENILAVSLDKEITVADEHKLQYEISLELITRVFLANSIAHRQFVQGAASIKIDNEQRVKDSPKISDDTLKSSHANGDTEIIAHGGTDSSELMFNETFERPLVFGFRSAIFIPKRGIGGCERFLRTH